jgi:endo-1,4-beta-xylanase
MTFSRRDLLALGAASAFAGPAFAADDTPLRDLAKAKGLYFGSAVGAGPKGPFDDPRYRAILARECGVLVPENELKWYVVRARGPQYFDFERADRIAAFAKENGQALRGHTLLWHHPQWFPAWTKTYDFGQRPAEAAARMVTEHIQALCGRYPQMISWDVVNETVDPKDGSIRSTFLSDAMGKEPVLDLAFHVAREAAPKARLVYNDYMGWEADNEAHRAGVLRLLEGFRKRGTPVDALGVQSHLSVSAAIGASEEKAWRGFVDEVVGMGYGLALTEFDVNDSGLATTELTTRDAAVAAYGQRYLDLMLSYRQVGEVLAWGMVDKYSWLRGTGMSEAKRAKRPLLYDDHAKAKPLREAVAAALRAAPAR